MNNIQKEEAHSICKSSLAETGHIETFDLEYHAQNASMEIELTQLSRGFFSNSRSFLKLPGLFISQQSWARACTAKGQVPAGCVMLGINQHSSRGEAISWCGTALKQNNLAIARAGEEFEFTTSENSQEALLLVDKAVFDNLLNDNSIPLYDKSRVLNVTPDKWLFFRETLSSTIGKYRSQHALLDSRTDLDNDRIALQELICRSIETTAADPKCFSASRSAVTDALNLLATMKKPITIRELASTLNVTQRALEIGFRKHLDTTPNSYTRLLRLNRAHHDLRTARPNEHRVSEIAAKWGFNHAGRFSVAYHQLFGETPSSTLKKPPVYRSTTILRP